MSDEYRKEKALIPFIIQHSSFIAFLVALLLLIKNQTKEGDMQMTRQNWLLLGAVLLGAAIVLYFVFFCPTECH